MRALISVSDKTDLKVIVKGLLASGFDIVSTGGTYKAISAMPGAKKKTHKIEEITGFPEAPDGLVKTLHPAVFFGILMDPKDSKHKKFAAKHNIQQIDVVVCNLYPFAQTALKKKVTPAQLQENIDIGGVSLIRAAAKNWNHTTVITDPKDYKAFVEQLRSRKLTPAAKQLYAVKAFEHTADYDSAIHTILANTLTDKKVLRPKFINGHVLRYGENWHQTSEFYTQFLQNDEPNIGAYVQHHGKALSYNNFIDGDAALECCKELDHFSGKPSVVIVKHNIQCGIATGKTLSDAFKRAWDCDPISAFGSVIAINKKLDLATAQLLDGKFVELIIAPAYDKAALDHLRAQKNKEGMRILQVTAFGKYNKGLSVFRDVVGGLLRQDRDEGLVKEWKSVTSTKFPDSKKHLGLFAILATKHIRSNASVIAREYAPGYFDMLGIGSGQPNRVDTLSRLAIPKAKANLKREFSKAHSPLSFDEYWPQKIAECVFASEAFFPFRDTVDEAAARGIKYIVQPGGSIRDKDSIDAANEKGIAMVFTGMRHFKH